MVIQRLSKCYQRLLLNFGSLGLTPLFLIIGEYFKKNITPSPTNLSKFQRIHNLHSKYM